MTDTLTQRAASASPQLSRPLVRELQTAVADPDRVLTRAIDLHANAHDASHFLLIPQAVVVASDAREVGQLLAASAAQGVALTFRSGGTSLSGQALTDGVLVDVRRNFKKIEVQGGGARVRVQPGVTVRALNNRLARYGRKFGPDPASEIACTIGGVIANNSSGMACGTTDNTYRTLESLTVVLPSGTVIDTGAPDADERLRALEPALHEGLVRLAQRVRGNPASVATIEHQFSMKNTMGYGVNSLLDYDRPVDILAHLIVGSEGTLGFVAEAVFRTVAKLAHVTTSLMVFDDLEKANAALPALVATGAATLELMDALSLKVGQGLPDVPPIIAGLAVRSHAALLVEYHADSAELLADLQSTGATLAAGLGLSSPAQFSTDAAARAQMWHLRKGLYAAVAGARPQGTTALLEDVVVPVAALGRTCIKLISLFERYQYRDSVIFGHAKDGNIHFMLTDSFAGSSSLDRYRAFTEDMVSLVLGEGGSLKAEHGTGRVMAPYVRRQYGDELYDVMRQIKLLCDPAGLLNPGVLMNDDAEVHLRDIKSTPAVADEVDRCVSCGYCEPVCPSREITLTPRQRIVTLRAIEQARLDGDTHLVAELTKDYDYNAVQTCAVDGMCQTACPVNIDTGMLVKSLRASDANPVEGAVWNAAAKSWGTVTRGAGLALSVVKKVPTPLVLGPNRVARAVLGADTVPLYSGELPAGGVSRARPAPRAGSASASAPASASASASAAGSAREAAAGSAGGVSRARVVPGGAASVVYFPACVSTMFGAADAATPGVQLSFEELCERANITLLVPPAIDSLCCGTPWASKGMAAGQATMRARTLAALHAATNDGELTIICDASSCTEGLRQTIESDTSDNRLTVMDAVEFAALNILPSLPAYEKLDSLALHPTCSSTRMGINDALSSVASAVADRVDVPENWGCCGFAGDRGMLHPELTASATRVQAAEVVALGATAHASCNRTCELGMTRAVEEPYRHVLELLAEQTRPA